LGAGSVTSAKQRVIGAGFAALGATGLHKALAPLTRGQGAILMLHHVRPWVKRSFAPNRLLEIEPRFLDAALSRVKTLGFEVVTMDEALVRLDHGGSRFVTLTFDDGYADNVAYALPILERHGAPFTLYVTTGYADRTARLWWIELEEAIRVLSRITVEIDGTPVDLPSRTDAEKDAAFQRLYRQLRAGPEARLLTVIAGLVTQAGLDRRAIVEDLCLDWNGVAALARHPLCTIGVHTLTHPMLAKHDAALARHELAESRRVIELRLGRPAHHLAYPVGDPGSAGPREYAIAAALGFASAVTTRPGMLFPVHRERLTALPRVSLNGHWQSIECLDVLLSGVPFALWNGGRRVVV
jgi:peptidoglycan/xylan/chitin deacetylase (PgdA/CDA1 family)